MSITVTCNACGKSFAVKAKYAGRRGGCPVCRAPVDVPPQAASAASRGPASPASDRLELNHATAVESVPEAKRRPQSTPVAPAAARRPEVRPHPVASSPARCPAYDALPAAIDAAFVGMIPPHRTSLWHTISLAMVAFVVVLLPLVYLGLIAAIAAGTAWWAVAGLEVFEMTRGRVAVFAYVIPLSVGMCVLPPLIKPLIPLRSEREEELGLDADQEPVLFHFVYRLCEVLGAPRPGAIFVINEVNAAASRQVSLWDLLSLRWDLHIGLPLIRGMTTVQLAFVVAHELGHFNQGASARLNTLIRMTEQWFIRAVYLRDGWDERLTEIRNSDISYVAFFGIAGQASLWLSRQALSLLLYFCKVVTAHHSRQLEFDADHTAARLAGSKTSTSAMNDLVLLSAAHVHVLSQIGHLELLPDDVPYLIALVRQHFESEVERQLLAQNEQESVEWFSSHPAHAERIRRINRRDEPGVFQLDLPATSLFRDFDTLSRSETRKFCVQNGANFDPEKLVPAEQFLTRVRQEETNFEAAGRYLRSLSVYDVVLPAASLAQSFVPAQHLETIRQVRKRVVALDQVVVRSYAEQDKAWQRHATLAVGASWLAVGFLNEVEDPETGQVFHDHGELNIAIKRTRLALDRLSELTLKVGKLAGARLFASLQLLRHRKIAEQLPEAAARWQEIESLVSVTHRLRQTCPLLQSLKVEQVRAKALLENWYKVEQKLKPQDRKESDYVAMNEAVMRERVAICARAMSLYSQLRSQLEKIPHPFEHAWANPTLADTILTDETDEFLMVLDAENVQNRATQILARIYATLCEVATQVEQALQLPPMPPPPSVAEDEGPNEAA